MSAQDKFNYYLAQVDKELSKYPTLVNLEKQTQVPKAYGVLGLAFLFCFFIFFNIAAGFLSNLLGWAIPAYFSLRALETPSTGDDVQWLTYWTVYGAFQIVETFADIVLYWFPFYYTFKTAFIVWLLLPQTKGASVIYAKVLRPVFVNSRQGGYTPSETVPPTTAH